MFLLAHGLARIALTSQAPDVHPAEWSFVEGRHGRPEIRAAMVDRPLRFNISHTRGLVSCVVADELDVGVDVERVDRTRGLAGLGASILAPAELGEWLALPRERQPAGFFRYWTLKEAYTKACGVGMSLPFNRCEFRLEHGGARLSQSSLEDGAPNDGEWQFAQRWVTAVHLVAIAIRRGSGLELPIRFHHWPAQGAWLGSGRTTDGR